MNDCSPVRRTMSATDFTFHVSWPPLSQTRSASSIYTCVHARYERVSLSGHARQRTRRQLTPCRSYVFVQRPIACGLRCVLVLARMLRTTLRVECVQPSVPPTVELVAVLEVVLVLLAHLPLLARHLRQPDAPPPLRLPFHGMVPTMDSTSGLWLRLPAPPDNVPKSSTFFHTFHPPLHGAHSIR